MPCVSVEVDVGLGDYKVELAQISALSVEYIQALLLGTNSVLGDVSSENRGENESENGAATTWRANAVKLESPRPSRDDRSASKKVVS